jgi:Kef-type K+ transport system membrane component KefB
MGAVGAVAAAAVEIDVVRVLPAVAAVILGAQVVGWAVSKIGQPRVVGEIIAGLVLGPSVLGLFWEGGFEYLFPPDVVAALRVLAQLGLVIFMFLIGLELDLKALRGHGHKAVVISHASIVLPIVLGSVLGLWLYPRVGDGVDRLGFVLFLGAAMAITAFPVLARVLQETGLYRTRLGVLAITCAAVDDVTAWCVLAGVVAAVQSTGPADTMRVIALSLLFVLAATKVVGPFLRRLPTVPVWLALTLALGGAWATEEIGIHAIFGAFMAGAVMPRSTQIELDVREKLETATLTLLLPIFFVVVGLSTRLDLLDSAYLWGLAGLVLTVAVAGKLGGSLLAARVTGESWRDATAIGLLMNTRGLTELVILTVGLELGVINETVFTIMVLMALATTFMATPLLGLILPIRRRGSAGDEPDGSDAPAQAGGAGGVDGELVPAGADVSRPQPPAGAPAG